MSHMEVCKCITVSLVTNDAKIFLDIADTELPGALPPAPVTDEVKPPLQQNPAERAEARYGHLLPHGTAVSSEWDEDWIALVIKAEKVKGYAICGAKRRARDLVGGDELNDPFIKVCKRRAGEGTDHSGEGRCTTHGGSALVRTGQHSLISNHRISSRVQQFFEAEELIDMRHAISVTYAAVDAMLDEDDEISRDVAQEIGTMMTRIANMVKQHNDIQEKKRISIEVPEFMAWAEFFYDLAVRHIQEAGGDVAGFLNDAQAFYDRTVTIVVGPEARRNRLGKGSEIGNVEDEGVLRPSVEVTRSS